MNAVDLANTTFNTTVTGKNQITIPADLARQMGIVAGSRIQWKTAPDGTLNLNVLPTKAELARKLKGSGRKYLRPGSDPVRDLIEERVREDED